MKVRFQFGTALSARKKTFEGRLVGRHVLAFVNGQYQHGQYTVIDVVDQLIGNEGQIPIKSRMAVYAGHRPAGLGRRARQIGADSGLFARRRVLSLVANPSAHHIQNQA